MTTKITNAAAKAACDAVVDLLDAGAGAGTLKIYSAGSGVPANADDAITDQVLLATLTLSDPAFGNAADINPGARATASAITGDSAADATGTAAFFRALDSNGVVVIQGGVGTSGQELNLNTVSLVSGVAVDVTSWTHTQPEQ